MLVKKEREMPTLKPSTENLAPVFPARPPATGYRLLRPAAPGGEAGNPERFAGVRGVHPECTGSVRGVYEVCTFCVPGVYEVCTELAGRGRVSECNVRQGKRMSERGLGRCDWEYTSRGGKEGGRELRR